MRLFILKCCAPFMVPPRKLVTSNVFIWTTFIPSTFLTHPIFFFQALFSYLELLSYSAANANFEGTLTFLLGRLCPSSRVLTNSNCMRCSFVSLSAVLKKDPGLPPRVFIGCLRVYWFFNLVISPLVLTPPFLHSRFFSIFLCSLSAFPFSFASLSFLILSNFSS